MTDNTISGHSFPGGASGKEPTCQCRRWKRHRFDLWVGRSPGEGHDNLIQYSCLQKSIDRRAWWAIVHVVAKNWTQLKQLSTHAQMLGILYKIWGYLY